MLITISGLLHQAANYAKRLLLQLISFDRVFFFEPGMKIEFPNKEDDFVAGDGRNQIHATLLSMHVMWLREHNKIADKLGQGVNFITILREQLFCTKVFCKAFLYLQFVYILLGKRK